jgi:putative colanic acid biosynthesis UDP-glucose lipid carrier transferase
MNSPGLFSLKDLAETETAPVGSVNYYKEVSNEGTGYLYGTTKRLVDFNIALVAILFLLPLFLCAAALIRLTSRGPVFYRQTRRGLNAKHFTMYKFRSMYVADDANDNFVQATRNDSRITPLGRVPRAASVDELPQLINVLRGEMSLIGPRPHPLPLDDKYAPYLKNFSARYSGRPGLSGLAQINGACGETPTIHHMKRRLDFDIQYVREASLFLDLKILVLTGLLLFFSRDAY